MSGQITFAKKKEAREKKFKAGVLFESCCMHECYLNKFSGGIPHVFKVLHSCHDTLSDMDTKGAKMNHLRSLLSNNITSVTNKGSFKIDYKVGKISVCRNAFVALHGITIHCIEHLVSEIKR
jgi:hypothetical protein